MDIKTSFLNENTISKHKDVENENDENRLDEESGQSVMGMKTNMTTRSSQGQNKNMPILKSRI
jgi:murein tripeptide amidase MpaA